MADTENNTKSKYIVAVASTDGETVNTHYGKAESFYIYSVDDEEGFELFEKRSVTPVCQDGSHSKSQMEAHIRQFKDCKYVIASKIGIAAAQALTVQGITSMELPGTIDDAMLKVWKYNQVQNLFK